MQGLSRNYKNGPHVLNCSYCSYVYKLFMLLYKHFNMATFCMSCFLYSPLMWCVLFCGSFTQYVVRVLYYIGQAATATTPTTTMITVSTSPGFLPCSYWYIVQCILIGTDSTGATITFVKLLWENLGKKYRDFALVIFKQYNFIELIMILKITVYCLLALWAIAYFTCDAFCLNFQNQ